MTSKEYLEQAFQLDQRINSKLEQVMSLRALAMKATATINDMPGAATPNVHKMSDVVCKIIDLEAEINAEIDTLVDLKREITAAIRLVEDPELQLILELRYLCFRSWKDIATDTRCSIRTVYRLHDQALENFEVPKVGSHIHLMSPGPA